jgi:hypothetical protein
MGMTKRGSTAFTTCVMRCSRMRSAIASRSDASTGGAHALVCRALGDPRRARGVVVRDDEVFE